MDDYIKAITYRFNKVLNTDDVSFLQSRFKKVEGIHSFKITPGSIRIDYLTFQLTDEALREIIKNAGFSVKENEFKKHGVFRQFIENLARTNRETFGNKRLECCDINHR